MIKATSLESVLKRDRAMVILGLAGIAVLAWVYMFYLAGTMNMDMGVEMVLHSMHQVQSARIGYYFLIFLMWTVMMIAMMLPSVSPFILMFASLNRKRSERQGPFVPAVLFLAGYLIVWTGFSLLAMLVQWALESTSLLSSAGMATGPILGGSLLLAADIFQWTPLKYACLSHCRTPMGFLMSDWREGRKGALIMGLKHGSFCVGCCWILMGLMFVAGVMNLIWMAIITIFVLLEKVTPYGHWVGRITGLILMVWGLWMISNALGYL